MKLFYIYVLCTSILFSCSKKEEVIACFEPNRNAFLINEVVKFDNCSENYISAEWDFGDGNYSTVGEVTHRYNEKGEHLVRLRVLDEEGNSSKASNVINVHRLKIKKIIVYHKNFNENYLSLSNVSWLIFYDAKLSYNSRSNDPIKNLVISEFNNRIEIEFENPNIVFNQNYNLSILHRYFHNNWVDYKIDVDFIINPYEHLSFENKVLKLSNEQSKLNVEIQYIIDEL